MAVIGDDMGLSFDDVLVVPQKSVLSSRRDADLTTYLTGYYGRSLQLNIPIVSANMPSVTENSMAHHIGMEGGFGFLHRFMTIEENVKMFKFIGGRMPHTPQCGISLGIHEGLDRFDALYDAGARLFLLDVAHAHSTPSLRFVDRLGRRAPRDAYLIVGNVATSQAVEDLENLGVDGIKVGVGPGAACTTREVTGAGRAQLTAIMECSDAASVPIIADGGIRNSGDIVKALAAGASTVMLGRLLAGCDESPVPGSYWGNASGRMNNHQAPEGTEGVVERTGTLADTLKPLLWGIRSGISYAGATGVRDLHKHAIFERVAPGVAAESGHRL